MRRSRVLSLLEDGRIELFVSGGCHEQKLSVTTIYFKPNIEDCFILLELCYTYLLISVYFALINEIIGSGKKLTYFTVKILNPNNDISK